MPNLVNFEKCHICHEGDGRFMIWKKDKSVRYVCGGCFTRREDHLRITGKDLLDITGDTQSAPALGAD